MILSSLCLTTNASECLSFISHAPRRQDVYYIWNELPLRRFGIMYKGHVGTVPEIDEVHTYPSSGPFEIGIILLILSALLFVAVS